MRRLAALLTLAGLAALAVALAGCGGRFQLPTESRVLVIPGDSTYQMQATWTGMDGIQDILLTQGIGQQLFLLFNYDQDHLRTTTDPRGEVWAYARLWSPKPGGSTTPPRLPITFNQLFSPWALCVGGDGAGGSANRIFILDQGDTTLARVNPLTGIYGDTTGCMTQTSPIYGKIENVAYPNLYWRVREYTLLGGDTLETFSDTSMAYVNGIAGDAQGRIYVSGAAIIWVSTSTGLERHFLWRIYRYLRGPKYPGVPDPNITPRGAWHRDSTWWVQDGSGIGSVADPRGLYWGAAGNGALYVADMAKNWVQKLSVLTSSTGYWMIDGKTAPEPQGLVGPADVVADQQGFTYVADTGDERVLRYDEFGNFIQIVTLEKDAAKQAFVNPVTVAADDSLVFVGDPGLKEVIRYKRRK
jgi:hypothetical protein